MKHILFLSIFAALSSSGIAQTYIDATGTYRFNGSTSGGTPDMLYIGNNAPVSTPGQFTLRSTGLTYSLDTTSTASPGASASPNGTINSTGGDFNYSLTYSPGVPANALSMWAINDIDGGMVTTTFSLNSDSIATFNDFTYALWGSGSPSAYSSYNISPDGRTLTYSFVDPDISVAGNESGTLFMIGNTGSLFTGYSAVTSGLEGDSSGGDATGVRLFALGADPIPEPHTAVTGLLSLALLASRRRRKSA